MVHVVPLLWHSMPGDEFPSEPLSQSEGFEPVGWESPLDIDTLPRDDVDISGARNVSIAYLCRSCLFTHPFPCYRECVCICVLGRVW